MLRPTPSTGPAIVPDAPSSPRKTGGMKSIGSAETGARLGGALFAYMLGVTLIITLLPFQFDWPSRWRVMFTGGIIDIVANVLLFLPLGFLFRLARRNADRHSTLTILWLGALASMAIETVQLFEVERYTSILDVATNAFGAWLGAIAADRAASRVRIDGEFIGRLSLELPLMGLVYLLIPLLWLNGLSAGGVQGRFLLTMLLGVFGASVLGGLQRHHFGPTGAVSAAGMAVATGGWFLLGGFPGLALAPLPVVGIAAAVAGLAWWRGRNDSALTSDNRRYEVPVLKSASPAYAAYLILLALTPLLDGTARWQLGIGFPGVAKEWNKVEILRFLELVAACTLLGYMVAEFRGRLVQRFRAALPRVAAWGIGAALVLEGVRGFHAGHGASVARALFLAGGTIYGAWLYYLQRAHVVRLIGAQRGA